MFYASEFEMNKQIKEYDSLKIYRSYRGVVTLLLSVSLIYTVVYLLFFDFYLFDFIFVIISHTIFIIFIYRGHKWAIVLAMVYYTIIKVFMLNINDFGVSFAMLYWLFTMYFYYNALLVEIARDKIKKLETKK